MRAPALQVLAAALTARARAAAAAAAGLSPTHTCASAKYTVPSASPLVPAPKRHPSTLLSHTSTAPTRARLTSMYCLHATECSLLFFFCFFRFVFLFVFCSCKWCCFFFFFFFCLCFCCCLCLQYGFAVPIARWRKAARRADRSVRLRAAFARPNGAAANAVRAKPALFDRPNLQTPNAGAAAPITSATAIQLHCLCHLHSVCHFDLGCSLYR